MEVLLDSGYHMYGTAKKNCGFDKTLKWRKSHKGLSMGDSRAFRSLDPLRQYIFAQFMDRKVVSGFSSVHTAVNGSAAELAKMCNTPDVVPFRRNRRGPDGAFKVLTAYQPKMFADYSKHMG